MALLEINSFDSGNGNGADIITHMYASQCLDEFEGHLYGVEMGICFGGGIEKIGKQWKDRGNVWGHDMIKPGHIAGCYEKYLDIMAEGLFEHEFELIEPSLIVVLKKK